MDGQTAERGVEQTDVRSDMQAHALGALFRALAKRIEGDPAFAQSLLAAAERGGTERGGTERGGTERDGTASESGAGRTRGRTRRDAEPPGTPDRRAGRPASPQPLDVPQTASQDASHGSAPAAGRLDPYAVLREHGEAALRVRLDELDLASLRTIVRTHRLDPARLSARWTARERLVELIAEQVRARAHLGRAFERV